MLSWYRFMGEIEIARDSRVKNSLIWFLLILIASNLDYPLFLHLLLHVAPSSVPHLHLLILDGENQSLITRKNVKYKRSLTCRVLPSLLPPSLLSALLLRLTIIVLTEIRVTFSYFSPLFHLHLLLTAAESDK